jgi:hypothetical protein
VQDTKRRGRGRDLPFEIRKGTLLMRDGLDQFYWMETALIDRPKREEENK